MNKKYGLKANIKNWSRTILSQDSIMQDAIKVLNNESFRIVLVADKNNKLLGTITDGDVRRAIMKNISMESKLKTFMYKKPTTLKHPYKKENALSIMKKNSLLHLPILDNKGKIIDLEILQNLLEENKQPYSVLIMAGGFGKRLMPITKNIPKPLLLISNKPILEIIIEQLSKNHFKKIFISTFYKSEMIQNYFRDGKEWNLDITYLREKKQLGTAGSLSLIPKNHRAFPILVMNSDLLTKLDFDELMLFHKKKKNMVTVCIRKKTFNIPYGVVKHSNDRIKEIIEKPSQEFFINAGIYVIDPQIFAKVKKNQYLDMTDLIKECIKNKLKVVPFPIHEYWSDIGLKEDFKSAEKNWLFDNNKS